MALFIRTKIKSGEKVQLIFITCSQADKSCPLVPGATLRSAIPYEDPQEADGTSEEAVCYDERSRQIATKMLYCFSQINGLSDSPA